MIDYLESLNGLGSVPGLNSITELLKRVDNPQDKVKFVHIAGTNGKGSVGAFLSYILAEAGYNVGRYASPAVFTANEIIQYNNKNISDEELVDIIYLLQTKCEEMVKDGYNQPTRFEVETAAAFVYFEKIKCDIAIVECGMGGRLDATNIIKNTLCAVITPISLDHTSFLGDTIEEIADNKSDIIKSGCSVVSAYNDLTASIIKGKAYMHNADVVFLDSDQIKINYSSLDENKISFDFGNLHNLKISLLGAYQPYNAALALLTVNALKNNGFDISDKSIRQGLLDTKWFGRFQLIGRNPYFIIDGAHNPDGALSLRNSLSQFFFNKKLTFIMGVFADKDYGKILDTVIEYANYIITIETPDNKRALPSKTLAEYIKKYYDVKVTDCGNITDAIDVAIANTDVDNAIIAFGSLSHLSLIYDEYLKKL